MPKGYPLALTKRRNFSKQTVFTWPISSFNTIVIFPIQASQQLTFFLNQLPEVLYVHVQLLITEYSQQHIQASKDEMGEGKKNSCHGWLSVHLKSNYSYCLPAMSVSGVSKVHEESSTFMIKQYVCLVHLQKESSIWETKTSYIIEKRICNIIHEPSKSQNIFSYNKIKTNQQKTYCCSEVNGFFEKIIVYSVIMWWGCILKGDYSRRNK